MARKGKHPDGNAKTAGIYKRGNRYRPQNMMGRPIRPEGPALSRQRWDRRP